MPLVVVVVVVESNSWFVDIEQDMYI